MSGNAANPMPMTERDKKLLLRVDAKDGEVVGGVRLSAKDTLRKISHYSAEAEPKDSVDRYWLLWVPRNFERLVFPYRVFRANRDALIWLFKQSEDLFVDPPPAFYAGMVFPSDLDK